MWQLCIQWPNAGERAAALEQIDYLIVNYGPLGNKAPPLGTYSYLTAFLNIDCDCNFRMGKIPYPWHSLSQLVL